jgi:hypothetical protein
MKKLLVASIIALSFSTNSYAADIIFHPHNNAITIDGEINYGDEKKFLQLALPLNAGVFVTFRNNPGGNLHAGIEIGKIIRLKGFNTFAPNECYSSCALAWSAGIKRVMNSTSKVGFHAAYIVQPDGSTMPTAQGNAIVGAYLNSLGFSETAIRFATFRDSKDLEFLDKELADKLGINVSINDAQIDGNVIRLSQAQKNALKMVQEGKWGCDTDFKSYRRDIKCWDLPKHNIADLARACLTGSEHLGVGSTAITKRNQRKVIIIKEDDNRPTCTTDDGRTGRGVYVRLL